MADRIVVMHDGRIEQIGAPLELYDHPDNLFVAQFIGSPAMNVDERQGASARTARRTSKSPAACAGRCSRARAPRARRSPTASAPATCALASADAPDAVPAEIVVVEPTGAETELLIQAGDAQLILVTHGRPDVNPGDRIGLADRSRQGARVRPGHRRAARRVSSATITGTSSTMSKKSAKKKRTLRSPHVVRQPRPRRARPPVVDEEPGHPARPVRRPAGDRHLQHVVAGHAVQRALPRARAARARRRPRRGRLPDRVPGDEPRRDADAARRRCCSATRRRWTSRSRSAPIRSTASCC